MSGVWDDPTVRAVVQSAIPGPQHAESPFAVIQRQAATIRAQDAELVALRREVGELRGEARRLQLERETLREQITRDIVVLEAAADTIARLEEERSRSMIVLHRGDGV